MTSSDSGETIAARAPAIDARMLRALRGGEHPVDARARSARPRRAPETAHALERFVGRGAGPRDGAACWSSTAAATAPTASGAGARPAVWDWLAASRRARAGVMALRVRAPARQGGAGATLVLLRRTLTRRSDHAIRALAWPTVAGSYKVRAHQIQDST